MKQKKSMMYIFLEGTAALFAILMIGLFPLFYRNNFIDISVAKLSFFRVCVIGMLALIALFAGMDWLQRFKEKMQEESRGQGRKKRAARSAKTREAERNLTFWQRLSRVSASSRFALIFAAGICISAIFSANPMESWQGNEARKLGAAVLLLCVAMYFVLGKYLKPGVWMIWTFFIANTLVCVLAILNFWAIDPLHMYENLVEEQHASFTSTIGNVNACSSYLCMIVPASMTIYALAKAKSLRAVSGAFFVLGVCTCYCTRSESWLLGVGAAFFVLLWFAMRDHAHMRRFLEQCLLFWAGSLIMKLMVLAGESFESKALMFLNFRSDKLQNHIMLSGYMLAAEGILFLGAMFFICSREKSGKELPYASIRKGFYLFLAAVAGIGIILFFAANLKGEAWEGGLSVLNRFQLQDSFGSKRGYIWKITISSWLDLPLWDKLTGYGVNYYHAFIQQYAGQSVAETFGGSQLVDAHNEFLQFLTTTGILGVTGYFGLLFSTMAESARKMAKNPWLLAGVCVVASYLAQGLVNNPTVFLTPYLFLILGILKSMEKKEDVEQ